MSFVQVSTDDGISTNYLKICNTLAF